MAVRKRQGKPEETPDEGPPVFRRLDSFTIPARADGSRWTYTAPANGFYPPGKRGPQDAHEMRAALEAITPYRTPKRRPPESIEAYAARMARQIELPPVGIHVCTCDRSTRMCVCEGTIRLPDEDPAPIATAIPEESRVEPEIDAFAADDQSFDVLALCIGSADHAEHTVTLAVDGPQVETAPDPTPLVPVARAPYRGAGAYSMRRAA